MKNLTIRGAFSGSARYYRQALDFLARHQERFPFDRLISGRYPLAEVNRAFQGMLDLTETKPVILPWA